MISLTSVSSIVGAFKSIKEAAESLVTIRDQATIMGTIGDINSKLIDAQNGIFAVNEERSALVQSVRDLEKEIADMKTWENEKQRYQLVALAPNIMAYQLKPSEHSTEPPHLLCANCYTDGKKSFLSQPVRGSHVDRFKCNRCGEELVVQKDAGPRQIVANRRPPDPNDWMR
jgi:hypothetical protein